MSNPLNWITFNPAKSCQPINFTFEGRGVWIAKFWIYQGHSLQSYETRISHTDGEDAKHSNLETCGHERPPLCLCMTYKLQGPCVKWNTHDVTLKRIFTEARQLLLNARMGNLLTIRSTIFQRKQETEAYFREREKKKKEIGKKSPLFLESSLYI